MQAKCFPTFISANKVAEVLGLSKSTVRKQLLLGKIPALKVGEAGHWRIPEAWLLEKIGEAFPSPPVATGKGEDAE